MAGAAHLDGCCAAGRPPEILVLARAYNQALTTGGKTADRCGTYTRPKPRCGTQRWIAHQKTSNWN